MNSTDNSIKKLLNLKDPNLIFPEEPREVEDSSGRVSLFVPAKVNFPNRPKCPRCGAKSVEYHGRTTNKIKYISADPSRPVRILLRKQRAKCLSCGRTFQAEAPNLVEKHKSIAIKVRSKVIIDLMTDSPISDIAMRNNISPGKVENILETAAPSDTYHLYANLPQHLCFDEVRAIHRQLCFICIDGQTHKLVGLIPGRTSVEIRQFFSRFSFKQRSQVKSVVVDLNAYYGNVAQELFPNAAIIIDRFHMVQMLYRSFNGLRVKVMKSFQKGSVEYNSLKCFWKLFIVDYNTLDYKTPKYRPALKCYKTDAQIVSDALDLSQELLLSYDVVHKIHGFIKSRNFRGLSDIIAVCKEHLVKIANKKREWTKNNPGSSYPDSICLNSVLCTIKQFSTPNNSQRVLNSCTLENSQFTNGIMEGTNRKVKQISRTAYGYHNFDHLLKRLRLELNYPKLKKNSKKNNSIS